ncbi:hypothetical protein [Nocardia sienata]|uniref:hypothetical protein n=1 Tax=Nocardia sienata TaxID=248552 RepID=UPI0007A5002F|nr:hypothetical protein [Nocardia sienata]
MTAILAAATPLYTGLPADTPGRLQHHLGVPVVPTADGPDRRARRATECFEALLRQGEPGSRPAITTPTPAPTV